MVKVKPRSTSPPNTAGAAASIAMNTSKVTAPASHAAVFPFTAMSVMGTLMSALFLGDRLTGRKVGGIAVVVSGLVVLSGLDLQSMTGRALVGDSLFIAAGTLWAGFGIVMRRHRLDPLLATAVASVLGAPTESAALTAAYAILRHVGVPLGKGDYIGNLKTSAIG